MPLSLLANQAVAFAKMSRSCVTCFNWSCPDKPDNGTEFHDYERVERAHGVPFYFATPYHSWERGTTSNAKAASKQASVTCTGCPLSHGNQQREDRHEIEEHGRLGRTTDGDTYSREQVPLTYQNKRRARDPAVEPEAAQVLHRSG